MNSLNDIIRRHLMEFMIRYEVSFKAFAAKLNVPEEKIALWVSGNHDFSLNEVSLIESGLNLSIITSAEIDLHGYGKTVGDLGLLMEQSLPKLSIRSQNVIKKLRKEYEDPFKLLEKINDAIEGKYNLALAGEKTLRELKEYSDYLSVNVPSIENKVGEKIDYLKQLSSKYKLTPSILQRISSRIDSNKPALLFLLHEVFEHSSLYRKNLKEIFNIYTTSSNDKSEMPLAEAADLLNVTRERIRQLKMKIDEEIVDLGIDFKDIFNVTILKEQYPAFFELPFIAIDKKLSWELNSNEGVKFSIKTIALMIKGLLYPDAELLSIKSNTIYLVPTKWTTLFRFQKLAEKVKSISLMSVWDRQEYFWDRIYNDMILDKNDSSIPEILKFVNYLLKVEYEFNSVSTGEISGIRPKHLSLLEKIYLAISHYNEPVKIEKIISFINSEFPQTKFTRSSIHAALIRSRVIMTFGKSGTYGLKEWEGKRENIKSGSIADLVFHHLESSTKPIHIHEIHFYVSQFRTTTKRSILSIMSLDTQHRFELYGNSFFGITGKNYDAEDTATNPISNKTIHEIRRLLSDNGPVSKIKIEQHLIKMYRLTSGQANHFIDEAVKSGRLKLIEGKVHLPSWIQGGLMKENSINAYHINQHRLTIKKQNDKGKHRQTLVESKAAQERLNKIYRDIESRKRKKSEGK